MGNAFAHVDMAEPVANQMDYLTILSGALKRTYPEKLLYATNFGVLGTHTAEAQAAAITDFNLFDKSVSHLDGIYYFAAQDYCGLSPLSECTSNNFLGDVVESGPHQGKSLAQVLVETCFRRAWQSPGESRPPSQYLAPLVPHAHHTLELSRA